MNDKFILTLKFEVTEKEASVPMHLTQANDNLVDVLTPSLKSAQPYRRALIDAVRKIYEYALAEGKFSVKPIHIYIEPKKEEDAA